MKKSNIFLSLIIGVIIILFTACAGNSKTNNKTLKENNNSIVGTWLIVKAEGTAAETNKGTKYVFTDDGKVTVGEGIMSSDCKYSIDGDKLDIEFPGNIILNWRYEIVGENNMTMENILDTEQKFWLEK